MVPGDLDDRGRLEVGAVTVVQEQTVTDDTGTASPFTMSFSASPTDDNLLVAAIFNYNNGGDMASSSGWSEAWDVGADDRVVGHYKIASSDGTNHTWTSTAGGMYGWMAEYSGIDHTVGLDDSASANGTSSSADSGNATASTDSSFAVGVVSTGGSSTTATQPGSWSEEDTLGSAGTTSCYIATLEVAGSGSVNYDPSLSTSDSWAAGIMVFAQTPDAAAAGDFTEYLPDLSALHRPIVDGQVDGGHAAWWRQMSRNIRSLRGYTKNWDIDWTGATTDPGIGDGVLAGDYEVRGNTFDGKMRLKPGATTTGGSGIYDFSLPSGFEFVGSAGEIVGTGWCVGTDASTMYYCYAAIQTASTFRVYPIAEASGHWFQPLQEPPAAWTGTDPFDAESTSCELRLHLVCEVKHFDPVVDIDWHTLLWGDGPRFRKESDPTEGEAVDWVNETTEVTFTADATTGDGPKFCKAIPLLNRKGGFLFDPANVDHFDSGAFNSAPSSGDTSILWVFATTGVRGDGTTPTRRTLGDVDSGTDRRVFVNTTGTYVLRSGSSETSAGAADNEVHHAVAVFSASGNEALYVDGDQIIDAALDTGATLPNLMIGRGDGSALPFHGYIGMVGVYDGDLSDDTDWDRLKSWLDGYYRTESV